METARDAAIKSNLIPYDIRKHTGFLRQLVIRSADYNNETMVIIIKPDSNKLFSIKGEFEITDIIALNSREYLEIKSAVNPSEFLLNNTYPNPFNPNTTITYSIPEDGNIKIEIYDINGKIVEYLENGFVNAGEHSFEWNAYNQPSGLYLLKVNY